MSDSGNGLSLGFLLPTCWRHKTGIASEIGDILNAYGCRRPLIVTDNALISLGVVEPVFQSLNSAGVAFTVCDSVNREPTAGTGSEVSDDDVVIDEKRNTKFVVISDNLRPAVALTDPLTGDQPEKAG